MEHDYLVRYHFIKREWWNTTEEICIGQKKITSSKSLATDWTEAARLVREKIETAAYGSVILQKIVKVAPL